MSVFDRFRASPDSDEAETEQLAPDDPDPKGEDRSSTGGLFSLISPFHDAGVPDDVIHSEKTRPPDGLAENWTAYYKNRPLTGRPLDIFAADVVEPGWTVTATTEGPDGESEPDDDMTDALTEWGRNCAIHASEINQDLNHLLRQLVTERRGKGTVLIEKAGAMADGDELRALVIHDPTTFNIYRREDKTILIQPDDDVERIHPATAGTDTHPLTDAGDAAAYIQYDNSLTAFDEYDEIPFSTNDIVKCTFHADAGNPWGTPIYQRIDDRIDALFRKFRDRDHGIRMAGYPHRMYSNEDWTQDDAVRFAKKYKQGEFSGYQTNEDGDSKGFAARVDFVSGAMDLQVEEGTVPDIADAVMDDIQAIFAEMPVSRYKLAFEENINQFVVEPQQEIDQQQVADERRYLEQKFTPIFEEKADELANGDKYNGDISFTIEPSEDDNPLMRESFPTENLDSLAGFVDTLARNGALPEGLPGAIFDHLGMDVEKIAEEYGFEPDELAQQRLDESTEPAQAQQEAFEAIEQSESSDEESADEE